LTRTKYKLAFAGMFSMVFVWLEEFEKDKIKRKIKIK